LKINLPETEEGGRLSVLLWILRAADGKFFPDAFENGAGLFSFSGGEQGVGKALQVAPVEGDLVFEGLFVGFLVQTQGQGRLTRFKRDAGL
jgi:hypothetical protein